jgi:hypothetical protein
MATHRYPLRKAGSLAGDLVVLSIVIACRLRRHRELVVVHDAEGFVRVAICDDPRQHAPVFSKINNYRFPLDREAIEEDLAFARHEWKPTP